MNNSTTKKTGMVSLIGKTNVGKSTLLNQLVEQKVSITSRKPQTTRQRLLGIKTEGSNQIIYVDTPGFHQGHKRALNKFMNKTALSSIEGVDIVLFVVDALNFSVTDEHLLSQVSTKDNQVMLVINKIDKVAKKEKLIPFVEEVTKLFPFSEVIPISALKRKNIDILEKEITKRLPVGAHLYPEDQIADSSERFLTSEIIREKCISRVGDEIPYRLSVVIDSFKEEDKLITIDGTIYIEKSSQKGIVIGEQGKRLKAIGTAARKDLERMLGNKVMLRLWVKVKKDWTNDRSALNFMGYKVV
ncbi:MAG: GTPase Era [SAR86 cluster bacterium]|jgi:GTP-binding protein Era